MLPGCGGLVPGTLENVSSKQKRPSLQRSATLDVYEAEVLPGLEPVAEAELKGLAGVQRVKRGQGSILFHFQGDALRLRELRTVVAVYVVLHFAVPRPKALLGHEHMTRLLDALSRIRKREMFRGFRISAAGSDSAVFTRLSDMLTRETGLRAEEEGELLLRMRRAGAGWDVLVRLTPRPLSARAWRVCNRSGGLNATLASAMLEWAALKAADRVFNPMCGSGTLLVEAGLKARPARLVGCDLDEAALECSVQNLEEAGLGAELLEVDATATGLETASFEVIVCDPPWGDAVGSHVDNAERYPALLRECARLAAPGARFVLLTHELKLVERVLAAQDAWRVESQVQAFHGGHYPRAYLLLPR